jgi:hypothetical protein
MRLLILGKCIVLNIELGPVFLTTKNYNGPVENKLSLFNIV